MGSVFSLSPGSSRSDRYQSCLGSKTIAGDDGLGPKTMARRTVGGRLSSARRTEHLFAWPCQVIQGRGGLHTELNI